MAVQETSPSAEQSAAGLGQPADAAAHSEAAGPVETPPLPEGGFARLSRRISRFTGNLVATVAVLLIAVVIGRQLIDYWRGAAGNSGPAQSTPHATAAANPQDGVPQSLDFGDSNTRMLRGQTQGDRSTAMGELRRLCREGLQEATLPASQDVQLSEQNLLKLIDGAKPAERVGADGEIFECPAALAMAVATRSFLVKAPAAAGNVAAQQRRVVVWSIAIPNGQGRWDAYAFVPRRTAPPSVEFDAPPGATKLISFGGPMRSWFTTVVDGTGTPDDWKNFYSRSLTAQGMVCIEPWSETAGTWHAKFTEGSKATLQYDIQISRNGQDGLRGLVTCTSAAR